LTGPRSQSLVVRQVQQLPPRLLALLAAIAEETRNTILQTSDRGRCDALKSRRKLSFLLDFWRILWAAW
jgi:hypothetical protein